MLIMIIILTMMMHSDDKDDVGHLRQLGHVIVQVLLAGHLLVSQEYRRVPVGDIYIMMKCLSVCLSVTKNDHFLLGVSCDHLNPP